MSLENARLRCALEVASRIQLEVERSSQTQTAHIAVAAAEDLACLSNEMPRRLKRLKRDRDADGVDVFSQIQIKSLTNKVSHLSMLLHGMKLPGWAASIGVIG